MTVANPRYQDLRFNADDNRWEEAKRVIGDRRVILGPQASQQYLHAPEHLAMVMARYRAAAALIGDAESVLELGCGEGIGAGILANGRKWYAGIDTDEDALDVARGILTGPTYQFNLLDAVAPSWMIGTVYEAVVTLDVIEHLPVNRMHLLMAHVLAALSDHGVCVIGTPNATFEHLASPQSKAGHVNLYTHARLHALMRKHFHTVQSFGMQDTSLHLGHPEARHYLLFAGIGPRRA